MAFGMVNFISPRRRRWLFACAALMLLLNPLLRGDTPPVPGSELSVYLMTFGPGEMIYERYSHNAIRIRDSRRGTDVAYNYGLFDMNESGFVMNFVSGRMMYWMEPWDTQKTAALYVRDNRTVSFQELSLTPGQRVKLRDFLEWNSREENKRYLYDYFTQNCSTKVRDVLDDAVGGQIKRQLQAVNTPHTYRWHSRRIGSYNFAVYLGLDAIMGHAVDRPLSAWGEGFLPLKLQEHLRRVMVSDEAGGLVPLVKREWVVYPSTRLAEAAEPPRMWPWLLIGGVIWGGVLALLGQLGRTRRWARILLASLATLWTFIIGAGGLVGVVFWALTSHTATYRNENLLQISPLALLLVVLIPAMALRRRWASQGSFWLAVAILSLSVAGLILKILPSFRQVNSEIIMLMLPAHLGLLMAVVQLRRWMEASALNLPQPPIKQLRRSKGVAMRMVYVLAACVGLAGLVGCDASGRPAVTTTNPRLHNEATIPEPPPRANVSVSASLKAAAIQEIRSGLLSTDPFVRAHAVEASREALGSAARDDILRALQDIEPVVRFAAAMSSGELRLEEARPTLHTLLADADPSVQIGAIFALHRLGDTQYSAGLEQALHSREARVRANAILALGRLGERSALRILTPMLRDPELTVCNQAAEAMWRLGSEDALSFLVATGLNLDPSAQMPAILALAMPRDPRVIQHVRAGLDSDLLDVKLVAARALGMLGSDEAYVLAIDACRSEKAEQRYLAALALGAIGRADAQEAIAPLLRDVNADVRLAASTAMLQLQ